MQLGSFGGVMYIIAGVNCIIGAIFGLILTLVQGILFFGAPLIGLLWLLPYIALTIFWGVGFCNYSPCLKITFGVLYLLI